MKKVLAVILTIAICFSAFAGKLNLPQKIKDGIEEFAENVEFKPIGTPTYKEYKADVWSFTTQGQYVILPNDTVDSILVSSRYENDMEDYYFNFDKIQKPYNESIVFELANAGEEASSFFRIKPCLNIAILKTRYKDFAIEGLLEIGLNTMIKSEGSVDIFGFDGIYFYGLTGSYKDKIQFKVGRHHYSGHFADELINNYLSSRDSKGRLYSDRMDKGKMGSQFEPGFIYKEEDYIRQDGLILGLSFNPIEELRLYAEADFLTKKMDYMTPYVLIPDLTKYGDHDFSMQGRAGYESGVYSTKFETRTSPYGSSYKDTNVEFGAEYTKDLKKWGNISLAYNCRLMQEGQTLYQLSGYDKDNKWDMDHTVMFSYNLFNSPLSFQAMYHNGRLPLLNWYWYRTSLITVGFSIEN